MYMVFNQFSQPCNMKYIVKALEGILTLTRHILSFCISEKLQTEFNSLHALNCLSVLISLPNQEEAVLDMALNTVTVLLEQGIVIINSIVYFLMYNTVPGGFCYLIPSLMKYLWLRKNFNLTSTNFQLDSG